MLLRTKFRVNQKINRPDIAEKRFSLWRPSAILKIVLSLYLSRQSSDLNEIWYADADCASKDGHMTKCHNFANSTWQTDAIMKMFFFGYIWMNYCLINAKFHTNEHNYTQTQIT